MTKHTPGPWQVDGLTIEADGEIVCWLGEPAQFAGDVSQVCADAGGNARLIAAAPVMLAALEAAVECGMVPSWSVNDGGAARHSRQVHVADQIRGAISKAKTPVSR